MPFFVTMAESDHAVGPFESVDDALVHAQNAHGVDPKAETTKVFDKPRGEGYVTVAAVFRDSEGNPGFIEKCNGSRTYSECNNRKVVNSGPV